MQEKFHAKPFSNDSTIKCLKITGNSNSIIKEKMWNGISNVTSKFSVTKFYFHALKKCVFFLFETWNTIKWLLTSYKQVHTEQILKHVDNISFL